MIKKNGWGLSVEIFFLFVFLICLFIAIIGIKQMGLFDGEEQEVVETDYSLLESSLVKSSQDYIIKTYGNNLDEDALIVRVSHLIKNNYLEKFYDNNGDSCSGYTLVYKSSSSNIIYEPYIKCKEYETTGYDINKDW